MLKSWNEKSLETVNAENKNALADGENLLLTSSSVQNREDKVELIQALIHRGLWWVKSVINSMLNVHVYCIITKCVFLWRVGVPVAIQQKVFNNWEDHFIKDVESWFFFLHKYERVFRRSLPDLRWTLFFFILPHLSTTESSKNWDFIWWRFMNHFTPNI